MDAVCSEFVLQFEERFSALKNRRIVLYGLGYRTQALLESLGDVFRFVGLMDRDKENIGKYYWGRRVLGEEEVVQEADCIIIISVSFYDVIYRRIAHLSGDVDIYFPNGERAAINLHGYNALPREYRETNPASLRQAILAHDVISFDLFDTLLMRRVLDPETIFDVMGAALNDAVPDFRAKRKAAQAEAGGGACVRFDEIYQQFRRMTRLPDGEVERIRALEVRTERKFLTAREEMAEIFRFAVGVGKEVFVVSDMYFGAELLCDILREHGIDIPANRIIVSCDCRCSKEDGKIWDVLKRRTGGKTFLHIGDDRESDIAGARRCGMDAAEIYSAKELMRHCVFSDFLSRELSLYGRLCLGLAAEKLFNSPFSAGRFDDAGKLRINSEEELGYVAYGTLILSYLSFIFEKTEQHRISKLAFCARDGYLLLRDYLAYLELIGREKTDVKYLKISQTIAMRSQVKDGQTAKEFAALQYKGSAADFFRKRFGITVDADREIEIPADEEWVRGVIESRLQEIEEAGKAFRTNYRSYLDREIGDLSTGALVDFGYTGTAQHCLSELLGYPLNGLYLMADMSPENKHNDGQTKYSYIYDETDPRGSNQIMAKCFSLIESVFTAPYGSFLDCREDGTFVHAGESENNRCFATKERINAGVMALIQDMCDLTGTMHLDLDRTDEIGQEFLARTFGEQAEIRKDLLDTFYSEDVLRYNYERRIF